MNAIFFRSKYGSTKSTLIDYHTTKIGWNPVDHWKYLKDPQGYSHTEIAFSKEATLWYVYRISINKRVQLFNLSLEQISPNYAPYGPKKLDQCTEIVKNKISIGNLRLCFSFSEKDNPNTGKSEGGRFKLIDIEPHKWEVIETDADLNQEMAVIGRIEKELVGLDYDHKSLLGYTTPLNIIKPSKLSYICSRAIRLILSWIGYVEPLKQGDTALAPNPLFHKLASMPQPLRKNNE